MGFENFFSSSLLIHQYLHNINLDVCFMLPAFPSFVEFFFFGYFVRRKSNYHLKAGRAREMETKSLGYTHKKADYYV